MVASQATARILANQWREGLRVTQGITNRQLAILLRRYADDAEGLVSRIAGFGIGAATRRAQLRQALTGARGLSTKLWNGVGEETRKGIFQSADLMANQAMDWDAMTGMPVNAILGYAEGMQFDAAKAAQAIISRKTEGFSLSQRVYRNSVLTAGRVGTMVESGLASGLSAREIARSVRSFISPTTPGGVSYAAMRLARSEINNAYHAVTIKQGQDRPWISYYEWNLSGSHPRNDACNELKDNGPYPKQNVPSKPHPQCLCFVTPTLPDVDNFIKGLKQGHYDDWLTRRGLIC